MARSYKHPISGHFLIHWHFLQILVKCLFKDCGWVPVSSVSRSFNPFGGFQTTALEGTIASDLILKQKSNVSQNRRDWFWNGLVFLVDANHSTVYLIDSRYALLKNFSRWCWVVICFSFYFLAHGSRWELSLPLIFSLTQLT